MVSYLLSAVIVFLFSGVLAMAGLGAAFIFVPLFYYMGISLSEATPVALLLNTISLLFAAISYWRAKLINWAVGLPMLVAAVVFSPLGALMTPYVPKRILLGLFAVFLLFAGTMMLFYTPKPRTEKVSRTKEVIIGVSIGAIAGFIGGLLGVGGGNFILPTLAWFGLDPKIAAATTAIIVVFSSFSGFLGHATLGGLDINFIIVTGIAAAAGSIIGAHLMKKKVSSAQLKKIIGVLLWLIALKIIWDVIMMH